MPTLPEVLLLWNTDTKSSVLESILSKHSNLRSARSAKQIQSAPCDHPFDVVFCGWSVREGTCSAVLEPVRRQFPDVPVVVFCHTEGEREWLQVLEAGALDLLVAPYWERTVVSVLEHAVAFREAQRNHTVPAPREEKAS